MDLPDERIWTINVAWRADAAQDGTEVDVVAFLLDNAERVTTDEDFVFYNAPVSEDGAVVLSLDGDSEQSIRIDLDLLPEYCERIVIAASLTGHQTFGDLGAVELSIDGANQTALMGTLDAGTSERTMLLTTIYRRRGIWRARVIGQGYDYDLHGLVSQYGVDVSE